MTSVWLELPSASADAPCQCGGYAHPVAVDLNVKRFASDSPRATEKFAADTAELLRPGDVVLLAGALGTGKTTFVRGAARALGVQERVTSPTYAIGNLYAGQRVQVAHLDLYRLDALDGTDEAALDDYLGPGRVTFIEWPHDELVDMASVRAVVTLAHAGGDMREISVQWRDGGDPA